MRIGRYEVEATLGAGGSGTVHRARAADGAVVAIKVMKRRHEEALRRFEREQRLQSQLGVETGFVPVLETGMVQGAPFLVMPLLAGGTLRDRLARGPLGVADTLALGVALAQALGRAHALGVIHRDVKPENVLFERGAVDPAGQGSPLLADLGLAKHFDDSAPGASASVSLSTQGTLRGTAGYMAPEQAAGSKDVGPPSDVFALGAVLYECLAGQPAFRGDTLIEVLSRVMDGSYPALAKMRHDVPRHLARKIEKALAADPRARYQDGFAFARALTAAPRSSRAPAVVVGVLVALAVAVGVVAVVRSMAPPGAAPPTPTTASPGKARAATLTRELEGHIVHLEFPEGVAKSEELVALEPRSAWARAALAFFLRRRDPERALAETDAALALDPRSAFAWAARVRLLRDPAEATACADKAIAVDERSAIAWATRAFLHTSRGEYAAGIADADRALALEPRMASAYTFRGACLVRTGRSADALPDATRAVELAPTAGDVWMLRADVRNRTEDHDGAIADATQALAIDPASMNALEVRGAARCNKKDFVAAVDDLTRAIGIDETSGYAFLFRSLARHELKQDELALSDVARALELAGESGEMLAARAEALAGLGDTRAARADFARSLELAPGHAHSRLAQRWLERNPASADLPAEASVSLDELLVIATDARDRNSPPAEVAALTRAIRLAPANARLWSARGMAYGATRDFAEAVRDAHQATEIQPGAARFWTALAITRRSEGEGAPARASVEKALALEPGLAEAWAIRGTLRHRDGDSDGALADAAFAVLLGPFRPELLGQLAATLSGRGQVDAARAVHEHVVAIAPESPFAGSSRSWLAKHPR